MPLYHRPMDNWWNQPAPTYTVPDGRKIRTATPKFSLPTDLPQEGADLSAFGEMRDPRMTAIGDNPTPDTIPIYVPFGVVNPGEWQ